MSGSRPTGAKAPNELWTDESFHWVWAQFPQASSQEQTSVYPAFQTTEPAGQTPEARDDLSRPSCFPPAGGSCSHKLEDTAGIEIVWNSNFQLACHNV